MSKNPLAVRSTSDKKMIYLDVTGAKNFSFFNKLKTGDFISFEGTVSAKKNRVRFLSANFVGLMDLIGTWYNKPSNTCVHVQNFTGIVIYPRGSATNCDLNKVSTFQSLSYTVNPESKNTWVALVTEQETTFLADFYFNSRSELTLTVSDASESGASDTTYILNKISN